MIGLFINVRIWDVLDILIVGYLMYKFYNLIKGTAALNIFIGIFSLYIIWLMVRALHMDLLGSILEQIIGVGIIALIILFHQEIRRFLLMLVNKYFPNKSFSFGRLLALNITEHYNLKIKPVLRAVINMSASKTGALIVISRKSELSLYSKTGDIINAELSSRLIETIFEKNGPLHDGALIIHGDKIVAARCVLPLSDSSVIPPHLGLRHRAAVGLSETTDALIIVVSEERGTTSVVEDGKILANLTNKELSALLEAKFGQA